MRPRTPVEDGSFNCRVQISQNKSGVVQEVALQECNGDPRWQASLIQAIQTASPLPAPPDVNVFSNLLTLELSSETYVPGINKDGYERVATELDARIEADSALEKSISDLRDARQHPQAEAIELNIGQPTRLLSGLKGLTGTRSALESTEPH